MKKYFTSESVTEGHPDKICDQISDAVLDAILKKDKYARVACETSITTGLVLVMGEITTDATIDYQTLVRDTIREIGYDRAKYGFDCETCGVLTAIHEQSKDIAMGVDNSYESKTENSGEDLGAGDQGMMFGYACDETETLMPLPIYLAHNMSKRLTKVRKDGLVDYLRPDGKTQVTVEYEDDMPKRIETVVLSTQHSETVDMEKLREDMIELDVFNSKVNALLIDDDVTNKNGIYPYLLTKKEKYLSIRAFSEAMKLAAYDKQGHRCKNPKCPDSDKTFELSEMEADHITPWHEGGRTIAENCQMLCRECNRRKSGK